MNDDERESLRWFRHDKSYTNGRPIKWDSLDHETMQSLNEVRSILGSSILIIRGAHPGKPSALDACAPHVPLSEVFQVLTQLDKRRWGVYAGDSDRSRTGSFHLDHEPYQGLPPRWMAVKDADVPLVIKMELKHLIRYSADGWTYLRWTGTRAHDALELVFRLAAGLSLTSDE